MICGACHQSNRASESALQGVSRSSASGNIGEHRIHTGGKCRGAGEQSQGIRGTRQGEAGLVDVLQAAVQRYHPCDAQESSWRGKKAAAWWATWASASHAREKPHTR